MKQLTLIIAALAFLTISSCKKDEEKKSKTDYLTSSPWKIKSTVVNGIDGTAFIPACTKDDTQKYNVGGTGLFSEGATKCDPADPQTEAFAWSFAASESQLIIDGETAIINTLDANTLALQLSDGADVFIVTYSH